MKNLLIMS